MGICEITASKKTLLSDLLYENGIILDTPCGKKGICGKCKIKATGDLSPVCDAEKKVLSKEELDLSFRLACKSFVFGKCTVEINENYYLKEDVLNREDIKACVAAVDIGTTVVEACFFSLPDFKLLKKSKAKNEQSQFGADVISRIEFARSEEGRQKLKEAVENSIKKLAANLYEKVERWIFTGNTTMLYLACGLDPTSISRYPFKAESLFGVEKENIYFPPCISSFVGADITTAILASEMVNQKGPSLLVDIGTNGEIVLFDNKNLYATSTSAGPAFEGASISMGMMATDGAIKKVKNNWEVKAVGDCEPIGICASGLIDVISLMLDKGEVDENGYLEKPFVIPNTKVSITPKDIRQVQLAKAAICAGIETMLSKHNIAYDDLQTVYIAGSLGNNVDIENCKRIGLLPDIDADKIKLIGNAALYGAIMILKDEKMKEKAKEIADKAQTVELALSDEFSKKYIENINFKRM